MSGPLQGVKVLDLSRVLAGPYCTMLLGDYGADVIKVEPPGGDDTRQWGPPYLGGESAYYLSCNRNKRSMVLDLSTEQGRSVLLRLARQSDVLVENFKLGTMERWGVGYEAVLRQENPGLVYCNISGFGRTGPYAHLPGYDFLAQAMGGLMSITGPPGGPSTKVGVAVSDLTTGMMAAFSILAALRHRDQSGVGQRVDISLLETQIAWLANIASAHFVTGRVPQWQGNAHASIVPYQTFCARDREMVLAVGNDGQFQKLCDLLERPDLAVDPRFATNPARVAHRAELVDILSGLLSQADVDHWVALCWERGVPAGPINSLDRVFTDPQVLHREMLQEIAHPTAGTVKQVGIPVKLSETPGEILRHPPLRGEHSREVLAELGYPDSKIEAILAMMSSSKTGR